MIEWLAPVNLIQSFGLVGIWFIIFAESGLFFGFFLPGDSLLFSAGLLAAGGYLPLGWLLLGGFAAAALGDTVGYWFGRRVGGDLWRRPDSRWLRRAHLERTRNFYERYGPKTIVLARFVPIVRTFAPILAGVGKMNYRRFAAYNLLGGGLWTGGLLSAGYSVGSFFPAAENYLHLIIAAIVLVSFLPLLWEFRSRLYNI